MTHGDKETPGNWLGEVRAPPRLGDNGPPEIGFAALRGPCPLVSTVTVWLAASVLREAGTSGGPGLVSGPRLGERPRGPRAVALRGVSLRQESV